MQIIILSGGVGSRLWPVSRKRYPKLLMTMPNGRSILENTLLRAIALKPSGIIHITSAELLFNIKAQWDQISSAHAIPWNPIYLLEPFGKNTAAAIAMASLWVDHHINPEELIFVMPSDHIIADMPAFQCAVYQAQVFAKQDRLSTFGIMPHTPDTGYGYIECDGNIVKKFTEKPSKELAKSYIESGNYLWNSGMFCFKAKVMLEAMAEHCPDILSQTKLCLDGLRSETDHVFSIDPATFQEIREDSIDYAVMEKAQNIYVVPCDIGWGDIGNWDALSQIRDKDQCGNVLSGPTLVEKTRDCYIEGKHRVIAAVGLENLVIVDTADALLVAHKDHAQDVKQIYQHLVQSGHSAHDVHTTVYRPWGSYTVLETGQSFKIKRIEVNPAASLSLQSHQHRSEHWVVVAGKAEVTHENNTFILNINESTYIPAGNKHRLTNPSETDLLVVMEIQTGSYVEEDDIQRFEDIYGRHASKLKNYA